ILTGPGGIAFQKNGVGSFAEGHNNLELTQNGSRNLFFLNQEANTDIFAIMNGEGNEVYAHQRGENGGAVTTLQIEIYGVSNFASVDQWTDLSVGGNSADIQIYGESN